MVGKGDHVPLGGDARMTNPAAGFVERFADGEFETVEASVIADHGKVVAVGGPIGPLHLFENFAGSTAHKRRSRQSSHAHPGADGFGVDEHSHLRCRRNRKKLGAAEAHGAGFGGFGPGGEDVDGATLPGGAVENGLTVGCEAGGTNAAAA